MLPESAAVKPGDDNVTVGQILSALWRRWPVVAVTIVSITLLVSAFSSC